MQRVIAAVLTLSLVGCGEDSKLEPEDQVTISGRATRDDGRALSGRTAILVKEPDLGELLSGATTLIGSMGLVCLGENPPEICRSGSTATTDDAGRFEFTLLGKDTQGSVGQASTFNLAVRAEPREGAASGASRVERFIIQRTRIQTPDLKLWEPQLSVVTDPSQARVTFGALPTGATGTRITFRTADALVWGEDYASGEAVDARLLEDATGTVSVSVSSTGERDDTEFTAQNVSESIAFTGRAGAPPSRNAVCTAAGASGVEEPVTDCALTDGDFASTLTPPRDTGCTSGEPSCESALANHRYTVDLGEARAASLLVVRGNVRDVIVERSADGATWAAVTLEEGAASLPAGSTVRYVRVRSDRDDTSVRSPAEISVW